MNRQSVRVRSARRFVLLALLVVVAFASLVILLLDYHAPTYRVREPYAARWKALQSDSAADHPAPPGARVVERRALPPCGGDSGFGAAVFWSYAYAGTETALFEFFAGVLAQQGWRGGTVTEATWVGPVERWRSAGFEKDMGGWTATFIVRTIRDEDQDFDVSLYGSNPDDCPTH